MSDLVVETFVILRDHFFDEDGDPVPFELRDKRNTQDDPFDEYLSEVLSREFTDGRCIKSPGPLITPDLVLMRPDACEGTAREELLTDLSRIVGIEVKKLERTKIGKVARASGLDYNTTPPCGTVRVYDASRQPLDIPGFYLFACLEFVPNSNRSLIITGMVLCDGNVLNADFDYYLSIVGERKKEINLGTYGDGADRTRPMLIFSNPLGIPDLDHNVTLIHPGSGLEKSDSRIQQTHFLRRSLPSDGDRSFCCYRLKTDVPEGWTLTELVDPFPIPARDTRTQRRGRFVVPFLPCE